MYIDNKYLLGDAWYVEVLRISVYLWTGFGVIDKGLKYGENKGYVGKIPMLRKPDNWVRNWRR